MRESDWSSDVCSSDLNKKATTTTTTVKAAATAKIFFPKRRFEPLFVGTKGSGASFEAANEGLNIQFFPQ
jgi:hypothetical protein